METEGTNKASKEKTGAEKSAAKSQTISLNNKTRAIILICLGIIATASCIWGISFAINSTASPNREAIAKSDQPSSGITSAISDSAEASAEDNDANEPNPNVPEPAKGGTSSDSGNGVLSGAEQDAGQAASSTQNATSDQNASSDPRLLVSNSKNDVKPKEHAVYLTFDDGPSDITPSILKTLEKNGVKATWFVAGDHSNLDMLPAIWEAGHQIALHTNSHNYKKIYKNKDAFFKDMDKIAKKVKERIGISPTLIRFPGGSINSYNKKSIKKIKKELVARNWHYFDWNASIDDAVSTKMRSPKSLLKSAKRSSKGLHSICLLMHDTNAKKTTAKALDRIIKYYKKNGYEFKYLTADSYGYHF